MAGESVLIVTDSGIEMHDLDVLGVDDGGNPKNLVAGTEYAVLNLDQSFEYTAGACTSLGLNRDTPIARLALRFDNLNDDEVVEFTRKQA